MTCHEAQSLVSVLYDGEPVPAETADHIDTCPRCRESLRAYAQMGAELRLLASRTATAAVLPPALLQKVGSLRHSRKLAFVNGKILVPRFAVALAVAAFLAFSGSFIMLHAQQSRPLWFQFELDPRNPHRPDGAFKPQHAVRAGYDDGLVWGSGPTDVVGTHMVVSAIQDGNVQLAIRSRRYRATNADQIHVRRDLADLKGHTFTYIPGKELEIPIEGGGTVILRGRVADHQPKLMAFGIPLEPDPDQLILSSPVLISGKAVLINVKGANTIAQGADQAAFLYAPGVGLLKFALRPFPGAVQGQASWGSLDFQLDGRRYSLLTASPMSGGDQPHAVWVSNNPRYLPPKEEMKGGFLGSHKLSAPDW